MYTLFLPEVTVSASMAGWSNVASTLASTTELFYDKAYKKYSAEFCDKAYNGGIWERITFGN